MSSPTKIACKDVQNIGFMRKSQQTSQQGTKNVKKYKRKRCWTPLYTGKHNENKQGMSPPTNNWVSIRN